MLGSSHNRVCFVATFSWSDNIQTVLYKKIDISTIRPPDYSDPELLGPKVEYSALDYSAPGLFGSWTIRPLNYSAPGGMEWNKGMELPNKPCMIEVS